MPPLRTLMLLLFVAATCSNALAMVLCARPHRAGVLSSIVRVREACLPGEVQLDAAELGLRGPKGDRGLPGPPGQTGPPGPVGDPNLACEVVRSQPGCPGLTPSGDDVCADQVPGSTCVATYLAVFTSDLRDARSCSDPIDACAIAGNELGGARVLCCRVTIPTTTTAPPTTTTTLPFG